jgi:hypothetical protein
MLSIFLGFFLTFSATVILERSTSARWLAGFGFFTALVNFIYGAFLYSVFAAEWVALGMFIVYILMVSVIRATPGRDQSVWVP